MEKGRYERQILYKGFGENGQRKIEEARVLVIGAGGLGSPVLLYLAGAGIGTIGIADADTVSLSNLHRQVLHPEAHMGMNKAESARICLQERNSEIRYECICDRITAGNAEEILRNYDFIVLCVDNFETRFLVNDLCVKLGKPFCNGGIVEMHGQIFTYVPGKGPCYRCVFEEVPADGTVPTSSEVGVVGPVCGIIGGIQASEVVKYFTGAGDLLTGRIMVFDAVTMTSRTVKFPRISPACRACRQS